ncbi:MAG: alkaline phosphatase family protein [Pirellulales bacterium]
MNTIRKVVVVGLDGLEPSIVEAMIARGELANLAALGAQGAMSRVATTCPAQTPVAWSTFATGLNPGGHGIFDFLRRDPDTYLPQLALSRHEQKNPFVPPRAVNLRHGRTVWEVLTDADIPSVILRCPCTYPPDNHRGRVLAGMGVPDLRGSLGVSTFFTEDETTQAGESETVVSINRVDSNHFTAHLPGPFNSKTGQPTTFPISMELDRAKKRISIRSSGQPDSLEIGERQWSDWLSVRFKLGLFQSVQGMVRFYLGRADSTVELYASPVNFDPRSPMFPISSPPEYGSELATRIGMYHTVGMAEDHGGLTNGRLDEEAFLQQCDHVYREREAMLMDELPRLREGMLFCLFDTPDRVQHMFWRFREPDHPANRDGCRDGFAHVIEDHYQQCDATVGKVLEAVDDQTLVIVLSDHGFNSFRRGVHLNTWLHDQGLLAMKNGQRPGDEAGDFFRSVDWSRTQAYAVGLGGIYLNRQGREAHGTVDAHDAERLVPSIASRLSGLQDVEQETTAVRNVVAREDVYHGPHAGDAPDLVVQFAAGYRASWQTALGGVPQGTFEDNTRRWAGDHIIDPDLVPGVLLMNRPYRTDHPNLIDLAPTILGALGVPKEPAMCGEALLP